VWGGCQADRQQNELNNGCGRSNRARVSSDGEVESAAAQAGGGCEKRCETKRAAPGSRGKEAFLDEVGESDESSKPSAEGARKLEKFLDEAGVLPVIKASSSTRSIVEASRLATRSEKRTAEIR